MGSRWQSSGTTHTLPWHRHGLAPSIPLSHTSAFQLSNSLLFPQSLSESFLFNLLHLSLLSDYSSSLSRSLYISLLFSAFCFYLFPPPPSPSVVTFRTSSSMRSSGRVEHYNNSLHRKLINLPDNVFIQKLKVEGYRTRSGVINQSQAVLYGLECPVMA